MKEILKVSLEIMKAEARSSVLALLLLLTAQANNPRFEALAQVEGGFEIDVSALVYRVVDGDTFDAFPVGRVRLADINAPELGEPPGREAREALSRLVLNAVVYLDVDDLEVMDRYNRLVCVAYVRYNSTHLLNVNRWLLDNNYAEAVDYPNEFKPEAWSLYVYYPSSSLPDNYNLLLQNYLRLMTDYLDMSSTFQRLKSENERLNFDYNSIKEEFIKLNSTYKELIEKYEKIKGDYDALQSSYNNFKAEFGSLKNMYEKTKLENERITAQLNTYALLIYIFIATTAIFGVSTLYLIWKGRDKKGFSIVQPSAV